MPTSGLAGHCHATARKPQISLFQTVILHYSPSKIPWASYSSSHLLLMSSSAWKTLGKNAALGASPILLSVLERTGRCQHQAGSGGSGGARWYPNLRCLNVNTNALHAGIFPPRPPQAQKTDEGAANGGLAGPISRDLGSIQTLLGIAEKPWISSCLPLPAPLIYRHTQWAQVEPGPKQEFCLSRQQGPGTGHGNPP